MTLVSFYFQVHQPFRLKRYSFQQIGQDHDYEDEEQNRYYLRRIAEKCYLPANHLMEELIRKHRGNFRIAFSISGTALEQFELYEPLVLDSFRRLVKTGAVEILGETYYHSLSFLYSKEEFVRQIRLHREKVKELLGVEPKIFRNTELIFNNDIADIARQEGFDAILCEGVDRFLKGRHAGHMYLTHGYYSLPCLLKNYIRSDDIAFRFSDHSWPEFPLTAEKYTSWLHHAPEKPELVNLFMDYETFGEHHSAQSGIFEFFKALPEMILKNRRFFFATPSEVVRMLKPAGIYHVNELTSWADVERDLSAWLENNMQLDAFQHIYDLAEPVRRAADPDLLHQWAKLQTSDHFYYMSTKYMDDGKVHHYFSPFKNPFDAYIAYMNVVSDFGKLVAGR